MPAPAIVATAGAANANSYLSIAAADAIADTMLGSLAWSSASSDNKARALITATNGLDTLAYTGERTSTTQALAWPRTGADCGDKAPASNAIPREVQLATFDLANALLGDPALLRSSGSSEELVAGVPNRDLRRLKLDVLELDFRTDVLTSGRIAVSPLSVLPHLATILGCLTTSTVPGGLGRFLPTQRS